MMVNGRRAFYIAVGIGLGSMLSFGAVAGLCAQQTNGRSSATIREQQGTGKDGEVDPLTRPLSEKQKQERRKALRGELKGAYKTWLEQDVAYIISDDERRSFKNLSNDDEREAFIEQFWLRRNPNPDSPDNEFREEHYRRIAYANEHYAAGKPGWKTDRGHIYIAYGKPDSIETHPSGGTYHRPSEEGGGETTTFPFESWTYRYVEGIGNNVELEFVDNCQCGDYHFTIDPSEKDALLHVPGGKSSDLANLGNQGVSGGGKGGHNPEVSAHNLASRQFDSLSRAAKLFAPPPIKFKDLDSFMTEHKLLSGPIFPFDVRTDYVKMTENSVLVPVTIQLKNRDITFVTKDGVARGRVNILGKVTSITHRVVQSFEDTVEVNQPSELLEKSLDRQSVYWKALPLLSGNYRLDIAIKDVNNPDHVGIYGQGIVVPSFPDDKLSTSTLILADQMNVVDSHSIGTGNFIIGNTYVRPRVSANASVPVVFKRGQQLNFWMQVYNLTVDGATKKNAATVTYQIKDATAGTVLLEQRVASQDLEAHSDQLTVVKSLQVAGLQPGKYSVVIRVSDTISKQEIAQSAVFAVE